MNFASFGLDLLDNNAVTTTVCAHGIYFALFLLAWFLLVTHQATAYLKHLPDVRFGIHHQIQSPAGQQICVCWDLCIET